MCLNVCGHVHTGWQRPEEESESLQQESHFWTIKCGAEIKSSRPSQLLSYLSSQVCRIFREFFLLFLALLIWGLSIQSIKSMLEVLLLSNVSVLNSFPNNDEDTHCWRLGACVPTGTDTIHSHTHVCVQAYKRKTHCSKRGRELRKRCLIYPRKTTHLLPLAGLFPQIWSSSSFLLHKQVRGCF